MVAGNEPAPLFAMVTRKALNIQRIHCAANEYSERSAMAACLEGSVYVR